MVRGIGINIELIVIKKSIGYVQKKIFDLLSFMILSIICKNCHRIKNVTLFHSISRKRKEWFL